MPNGKLVWMRFDDGEWYGGEIQAYAESSARSVQAQTDGRAQDSRRLKRYCVKVV